MKIQTKLIFLLFMIVVFFAILFIVLFNIERKRSNFLFDERKKTEMRIFDKVTEVNGYSLKTLAYDYTYWDEMVNFIAAGNKAWAQENINASVLSNFQADAIWVYKTDLSLAYSINNLKLADFEEFPLPKDAINSLFSHDRFCYFFINTPRGLMEVRGATIHPTADAKRITAPRGYFLTGRLWDNDYINLLQSTTGAAIVIVPVRGNEPANRTNLNTGLITFSKILTGWDKKPLVRIDANIIAPSIGLLNRMSKRQLSLFIIFSVIVLSFTVFSITHWIGYPLQLISLTLNTENTLHIDKLLKAKDEFGEISRLIDKFFKQRANLTAEISARILTEQQLMDAYEKVKHAQTQLIQASKMSGVGSLASGVAHEINNPLTGVLNNVQLVKMSMLEGKKIDLDDFKEILDSMEESAQRCVNITRALLEFGRPSKGLFQPVSIKEIIGRVLILIRHELEIGNIEIHRIIDAQLPDVKGDSQFLQQAIFDIIANAVWAIREKHNEEGGAITIKAACEPEKNAVNISITDNGIGIPEKNIKKIFEPFFTTKGTGKGAGLGLFMVYNIIEQHKGEIEVESKINEGTTFKISLPIV